MGYSIELHAEVRSTDGTWGHVGDMDRHFVGRAPWWSLLGMDLYPGKPIASERGLPVDASAETKEWFSDAQEAHTGHWASWFTLAELRPHVALFADDFVRILDEMSTFGATDTDVRLVFWFTM